MGWSWKTENGRIWWKTKAKTDGRIWKKNGKLKCDK